AVVTPKGEAVGMGEVRRGLDVTIFSDYLAVEVHESRTGESYVFPMAESEEYKSSILKKAPATSSFEHSVVRATGQSKASWVITAPNEQTNDGAIEVSLSFLDAPWDDFVASNMRAFDFDFRGETYEDIVSIPVAGFAIDETSLPATHTASAPGVSVSVSHVIDEHNGKLLIIRRARFKRGIYSHKLAGDLREVLRLYTDIASYR